MQYQKTGEIINENSVSDRLSFFKKLQTISNKIHAASNIDQIIVELSGDICDQFDCDRLTLYTVSDTKTSIDSKVKTGLKSFRDFSLPISEKSIAGYVALSRRNVNLRNVYDDAELKAYSPGLQFLKKVDMRTGYVTRQMLAGPILRADTGELLGVLQLINNRSGEAFSSMMVEGLKEICETLAVAFANRLTPPLLIQTKYDPLVANAVISLPELDLAARAARRKGLHIEDVLIDEFQVQPFQIGESLAQFFGVYYEPYLTERHKPEALKNFKRVYVEHNHWLVLEEDADGLVIMTTDPNRIRGSLVLQHFFPKIKVEYCVTTYREFNQTVAQFFEAPEEPTASEASPDTGEIFHVEARVDTTAIAEHALISRVRQTIGDAFRTHAPDIRIKQHSSTEKIVTRLRKDGSIQEISGQVMVDFCMNISDDISHSEPE